MTGDPTQTERSTVAHVRYRGQGTFQIAGKSVLVLIDPRLNFSYVSSKLVKDLRIPLEPIHSEVIVTNPLEHSAQVRQICRGCPIWIHGIEFTANLIELPFDEFEVILGMDWLYHYHANVDCRLKRVMLKSLNGLEISVVSERINPLANLILMMSAQKLMLQGFQAYITNVIDTRVKERKFKDILIVREFPKVFLEELSGLPPDREVEFHIEVMSGLAPISMTPYRIAPK
ncbi:uncharacterized protein LOC120138451 [Hibiscus syriacus]|uniref:uncharacterized protein LOC120138451 n=1 Tax=Hibiscus syriacus TaxID=106335 RepID=UPI00192071E6|nr:uncharacterized protein LOC120138451 [Hibiscus syriacus]